MFGLEAGFLVLLIICILACCIFEFINGFHDTANAVATVIYTNSLKPHYAVILSGVLNFFGVFMGGIGVAMGIVGLLPLDALMDPNINLSISMTLAILITAIIWNLGTWYLGIPCSSSHTLIGSIIGVGVGYSIYSTGNINNVNWDKAGEMGLSLFTSPLFGFGCTLFLMLFLKFIFGKQSAVFKSPIDKAVPPWPIRLILILTCSGVSFSHGSNDGQKGVGLMMVILIGFAPAYFALDPSKDSLDIQKNIATIQPYITKVNTAKLDVEDKIIFETAMANISEISMILKRAEETKVIPDDQRNTVRKNITLTSKSLEKLSKKDVLGLSKDENKDLRKNLDAMDTHIEYAPFWVLLIISLSLGLGTMIGWKRIVVTIGEKIGKEHLTYAQGASSEIVAASTIGLSTFFALPVSTTHVLSSGIAGSMVANKGLSNLQGGTIRNIAIAWILTLPVCISLAMGLFFLFTTMF